MKVKFNDEEENLWCLYCKERITLGEKYIETVEKEYDGDKTVKCYHTECVPEMEDED